MHATEPATSDTPADSPAADSPGSDPAGRALDWIDAELERRDRSGLTRRLRSRPAADAELDLAGTDYLGLARDKRVAGAAAAAALRWGAGATGSRQHSGSTEVLAELEQELARFCGTQAALVFSSGFTANLAAVTALSGAESAIVTDRQVHPSLAEGCRLSRADVAAMTHGDLAAMTHALTTRRKDRALVVTDSVFPVAGDLAPLTELATACRAHRAALLVDDTHGFGVLGEGGRGAVAAAGLAGEPDVVLSLSLAAALGAQGGAVLGPRRVIRHLGETARGFLSGSALAPASAAAALSALGVLRAEPERAEQALNAAGTLYGRLSEAGFTVAMPEAAVLAVRAPSPQAAATWASGCAAQGVRVACFHPPAAPDSASVLRLTAHAGLTESDVDRVVTVLRAAGGAS